MKAQGRGFACIHLGTNYHFGMRDESHVRVQVTEEGHIIISTAMQELGQGTGTTLAYLVSQKFNGMDLSQIHIPDADSSLPDSGYTAASRQTTMTGNATIKAVESLQALLLQIGSEMLDVDPNRLDWQGGHLVNIDIPEQSTTLEEMFYQAKKMGVELAATAEFMAPETTPLDEESGSEMPINSFSYATAVADVEVDTETGVVRVIKMISVHDSGTIINLAGAKAQVEGGLVMGLGFALTEDFINVEGIPQTEGFTHYAIPTIKDAPEIEVHFIENHKGFGPYGAKGLGEVPMVVAAPAIINAIYDAVGVRIKHLPASPEKIVKALRGSASV
jgi:CO/xanthine dehydrogenase Mo-binding subunit